MKKTTIVIGIVLVLASLVLPIVQCGNGPAPGHATNMDIETCKLCHTDYLYTHHTTEMYCMECHTENSFLPDCALCHESVDHHEDAAGRCSDCHENKQRQSRR